MSSVYITKMFSFIGGKDSRSCSLRCVVLYCTEEVLNSLFLLLCVCAKWIFYTRAKALSQQFWIQEATVAAAPSPQWVGSAVYGWRCGGWGPAVATQHVYAPVCPERWAADGGSRSLNLSLRPALLPFQHKATPAERDLPPLPPAWKQDKQILYILYYTSHTATEWWWQMYTVIGCQTNSSVTVISAVTVYFLQDEWTNHFYLNSSSLYTKLSAVLISLNIQIKQHTLCFIFSFTCQHRQTQNETDVLT